MSYLKYFNTLATNMGEGIYIYKRNDNIGVISLVRVEEISKNIITLKDDIKTDCSNLIYSTYSDNESKITTRISNIISSCSPKFSSSDCQLWVINDKLLISAIFEDFAPKKLVVYKNQNLYEKALMNTSDKYAMMVLSLNEIDEEITMMENI